MHSSLLFVASLALLAACAGAPPGQAVIQQIPPKAEQTPSATGKDGAKSGAVEDVADASESQVPVRARRDVGQESDLLPSALDAEASPFGQVSNLQGRGRIRVLPAFLG